MPSELELTRVGSKPPMRCGFEGCQSKKKVFWRPSEYKKHCDRHLRPYKCPRLDCSAVPFGDAGGLGRHMREVHRYKSQHSSDDPNDEATRIVEFFCSEPSCQRSTKGFPRRWNLMEHKKRVHHVMGPDRLEVKTRPIHMGGHESGSYSPRPADTGASSETARNVASARRGREFDDREVLLEHDGESRGRGEADATTHLHVALRKLECQRQELDSDIDTLKQVLRRCARSSAVNL